MMTARKRRKIARKKGTSRHFLISQTDSRKVAKPSEYGADRIQSCLIEAFPEILSGKDFLEQTLQRIGDGRRFAGLVVRPDGPPDTEMSPSGAKMLIDIAACLSEICRGTGGWWGVEDTGMLAGLWPERGTDEAIELGRQLQDRVRTETGHTVTIGAAAFPAIDYPPQETLENARKAAEHAAFFGPDSRVAFDAVSLNISGDRFYERGDLQAAMHEFQKALQLDPQHVNVRNSLGVCYGEIGDYERALAEFSEVLRLEDREYMAVYNMGLIHLLLDRKDEALECFLKAHALRADVFEVLFQTGKLYVDIGQPQSARPYLEQAARLRTRSGSVYRVLGDCYASLELSDQAITAYKKAVKANPGDSMALSALGCLFDKLGENPEIAMVFCKESVRLAPENPLFHHRLAGLYFKHNRLEEALQEFEQAGFLGQDAAEDIRRVRQQMAEQN
jgi:tetratricopeptide (TPR) repeat protein